MRLAALALLLASLSVLAAAANYSTAKYEGKYADNTRDGHQVPVQITYPTDSSASSFPIVVFSHGLLSGVWFEYLGKAVAESGFIFAALADYVELDVSDPNDYACDLLFLLQEIPLDKNFPLYGKVDASRSVVSGHSEGGAGSYVAANQSSVVGCGPYNAAFSAGISLSGCLRGDLGLKGDTERVHIPWLVMAATLDCICVQDLEHDYYTFMDTDCKYFVDLVNGSHCNYCEGPTAFMDACLALEVCHIGHTILSEDRHHELVVRYYLPWLNFVFGDGANAQTALNDVLSTDSGSGIISYENGCPGGL